MGTRIVEIGPVLREITAASITKTTLQRNSSGRRCTAKACSLERLVFAADRLRLFFQVSDNIMEKDHYRYGPFFFSKSKILLFKQRQTLYRSVQTHQSPFTETLILSYLICKTHFIRIQQKQNETHQKKSFHFSNNHHLWLFGCFWNVQPPACLSQ